MCTASACCSSSSLTGTRPFLSSDYVTLAVSIATQPTPHVCGLRPDVPAALDDLIARAMAKEAATRCRRAAELRDGLMRVRDELTNPRPAPIPEPVHDWWRLALTAAAIGVLALISWFVFRPGARSRHAGDDCLAPVVSTSADDPELDEIGVLLGSVLSRNLAALPGVTIVSTSAGASPPPPDRAAVMSPAPVRDYASRSPQAHGLGTRGERELEPAEARLTPIWEKGPKAMRSRCCASPTSTLASALERDLALGRSLTSEQRARAAHSCRPRTLKAWRRTCAVAWCSTRRRTRSRRPGHGGLCGGHRNVTRRLPMAQAGLSLAYLSALKHARLRRRVARQGEGRGSQGGRLGSVVRSGSRRLRAGVQGAASRKTTRSSTPAAPSRSTPMATMGVGYWVSRSLDAGQLEAGLAELRQAAALRPRHWINQYTLGVQSLIKGRNRDAVEPFKKTIELRPAFPDHVRQPRCGLSAPRRLGAVGRQLATGA